MIKRVFRKKKKVTSIVEVLSESPSPFVSSNVRKIVTKGYKMIIPSFFVWKTICKFFKFTIYEVVILKLIKIQKNSCAFEIFFNKFQKIDHWRVFSKDLSNINEEFSWIDDILCQSRLRFRFWWIKTLEKV